MRISQLAPFCLALATLAAPALARPVVPLPLPGQNAHVPPASGSWASELVQLADLVKPNDTSCADHCFVLEKMTLSGAIDHGTASFELEGALLHPGSYEVPLFGPAGSLRLVDVTENGGRATIGFEEGHYYLHTSASRFVLRGKLVLPEDRTVTIIGPLNALDADLKGGRITEGAHLTALASTALHFDAEGDAPHPQPPIFSIARALRVGKNIEFEYKLTAQAGSELGVVHLPLRNGERVVDVAGATGWRVESEELLLPTTGKKADVTVTGTIANVASFTPDPRAPFEWWLLESDGEHRVLATGDSKQHDVSESPIVRREPNSRLFLVQRGQHLDVTVQTLQSLDVLAATVRSHYRTLVLTSAGDLVMQDVLSYDNNGLDYLYFTPDGKPLYLATDGASERVMHKDGSDDLMIPMRMGQHSITVQSLSQTSVGALFGRIALPGARVPLATSSESLTIGLPSSVHPIVVTGGEQTKWPLAPADGIALALSAIAAALAFSGWKRRSLGAATLLGLWFVSKPVFVLALAIGVCVLVAPYFARLGKITRRVTLGLGLLAAFVVGIPALVLSTKSDSAPTGVAAATLDARMGAEDHEAATDMKKTKDELKQDVAASAFVAGNTYALPAQGQFGQALVGRAGVLDGVRPVALSLPSFTHAAYASRELVTPTRAFTPILYYITDSGLALLALAWLSCAAGLAWLQRDRLRALREKLRASLAPKPAEAPVVVAVAEASPAE